MRVNREGKKKELMARLEEMLARDRSEDIYQELINIKLQLNFEIDKDEMY